MYMCSPKLPKLTLSLWEVPAQRGRDYDVAEAERIPYRDVLVNLSRKHPPPG